LHLHDPNINKREEKKMKIDCPSCGSEVSLDHKVFEDYDGPVKCFCCGTMVGLKTEGGIIAGVTAPDILPGNSKESGIEPAF
jgi:ribosomal protein S27E